MVKTLLSVIDLDAALICRMVAAVGIATEFASATWGLSDWGEEAASSSSWRLA
jgi:hypothetical protein